MGGELAIIMLLIIMANS